MGTQNITINEETTGGCCGGGQCACSQEKAKVEAPKQESNCCGGN